MVQSQASSFDAISPTALMVAYTRQFTDIPYGKKLAQLVNAESFIEGIAVSHEAYQQMLRTIATVATV